MCEFCQKHGQGNRWYLNPENFSDRLLEDPKRVATLEEVAGWGIDYYIDFTSKATKLINWPVIGGAAKRIVNRMAPNAHGGQVVSLEDSLQLLEYARDFVLLPCACRRLMGHKDDLVCLNFGPVKEFQRRAMPEGPMEELTLEEAKEVVCRSDVQGHFHQVLYAKMPFHICICNCDARYCTSLKQRLANNVEVAILKGHEVCQVDEDRCRSCEEPQCLSACSFGALSHDREAGRITIDLSRCFGCGLCRTACEGNALHLVPRGELGATSEMW
jgi:heterodisulfide reductase subunit A-like polyferredoxin